MSVGPDWSLLPGRFWPPDLMFDNAVLEALTPKPCACFTVLATADWKHTTSPSGLQPNVPPQFLTCWYRIIYARCISTTYLDPVFLLLLRPAKPTENQSNFRGSKLNLRNKLQCVFILGDRFWLQWVLLQEWVCFCLCRCLYLACSSRDLCFPDTRNVLATATLLVSFSWGHRREIHC